MGNTQQLPIYGKDRILLSKQFEESSSVFCLTLIGYLEGTNCSLYSVMLSSAH